MMVRKRVHSRTLQRDLQEQSIILQFRLGQPRTENWLTLIGRSEEAPDPRRPKGTPHEASRRCPRAALRGRAHINEYPNLTCQRSFMSAERQSVCDGSQAYPAKFSRFTIGATR